MKFIKTFKELSKKDVSIAGGKGASLGEMTKAGIIVPPGFVVLASAFERFIEETEIESEIEATLHKVNSKDINSVEVASENISAILLHEKIPKDVQKEILEAFKKLNAELVAVRSSATAEDSSVASWAGELESYLNVTEKNLLNSVRKCWSSLFTPRAIFYRFEKKMHKQKVSVAVVVQKMVQSEVSGITFTVHPVTQDYDQMVIEAGYGLGEAIVGGKVTPDTYVVHKKSFKILENSVSTQHMMVVRSASGTHEVGVPEIKGARQKLVDNRIIELAKLCLLIEKRYKHPQDIEWAFEGGKFYIVQSRPITTLK